MAAPRFVRSFAKYLWTNVPLVRTTLRRLMRLALRHGAALPPPAETFRHTDLAARTDEYNAANETYFAAMSEDAKRWVGHKPYSDAIHFGRHLHDVGLLVHHLRLAPGDVVLELGAGTCWLSLLLNRFGCPTVAVDVSPSALEIGKAAFERETGVNWALDPKFLTYDGHHIPLPDASVDRVICYDAFHHVPNQSEILAELARVLRPGGIAGMIEPGRRHSASATSRMEMEESGVLENDIVVEEVSERALAAGFSKVNLLIDALGAGFEIPADRLPAFIAGDWLEQHWALLTQHLVSGHILLFYRGDFVATTRRPEHLNAQIEPHAKSYRAVVGQPIPIRAIVTNRGTTRFLAGPAGGYGTTYFGGHLHRAGEAHSLAYGWLWLPLSHDLDPGQSLEVEGMMPAIAEPGRYRVELDLVADRVTWFTHQGSPTVDIEIEVAQA